MSKLHAALLASSVFALPLSPVSAQVIFGPGMQGVPDRAIQGRALEDPDVYTCQGAPGGSRMRPNCEFETTTASHEQEIKLSFMLNPLPSAQCGAATTTEYQQLNTIARVKSTLEIADCSAASGEFTVALRTKDENGEEKPLEFSEAWGRSDAENVTFAADYPIGENVELVSVRLRGLTCTCADVVPEEPPSAED